MTGGFGRAAGVNHSYNSTPENQPRVERSHRTLELEVVQGRWLGLRRVQSCSVENLLDQLRRCLCQTSHQRFEVMFSAKALQFGQPYSPKNVPDPLLCDFFYRAVQPVSIPGARCTTMIVPREALRLEVPASRFQASHRSFESLRGTPMSPNRCLPMFRTKHTSFTLPIAETENSDLR